MARTSILGLLPSATPCSHPDFDPLTHVDQRCPPVQGARTHGPTHSGVLYLHHREQVPPQDSGTLPHLQPTYPNGLHNGL